MILAFSALAEEMPREIAERRSTAAFRTVFPAGPPAATTRVALVQDLDGPFIGELTLRGQVASRRFSASVEIAGTAAASGAWSGAGLGNTVVDLRGLFGGQVTHALGLRAILPSGDRQGPRGAVGWWGTVPAATVPSYAFALAYEGATPRAAWHAHVGLRSDPFWAYAYFPTIFDLGASVATVQPFGPSWSAVGELELLASQTPIHVRGLARRALGPHASVDVGLALPLVAMLQDPSIQLIGAARASW